MEPNSFLSEESTAQRQLSPDTQPRRLCLLVIGDGFVSTHPLPTCGQLIIGRSESADVRIEGPSVSRRHARLHVATTIQIEDLGSANGTVVREVKLSQGCSAELTPGDVVELGSSMLIVQDGYSASRPRRVWTHGYFEARLEEECARAERTGAQFGLLRARIATNKPSAAPIRELLLATLRPTDILASYGPNDYEVLVVDADRPEVEAVVTRLRERVEHSGVALTVGAAYYPTDSRTPEVLMAKACAAVDGRSMVAETAGPVVIQSGTMRNIHRLAERIAGGEINVLLLGETGVGKEVFAERIHATSPRRAQPLLRLNCAALSESLLESELFGHARGAFTGATQPKQGLLETANGGTVFLDEIGDMPLSIQAKLLRVLEERQIRRIGSLAPRQINVRFIAATNRNLERMVDNNRFRQDLFYRLNGVSLVIPPLRARTEEIAPLAELFVTEAVRRSRLPTAPRLTAAAIERLKEYDWPGNVRELRNVIERAVLLCNERDITPEAFSGDKLDQTCELSWVAEQVPPPLPPAPTATSTSGKRTPNRSSVTAEIATATDMKSGVQAAERKMIVDALKQSGGNQTRAAKALGISRRTLITRMDAYSLPRPRKHTERR